MPGNHIWNAYISNALANEFFSLNKDDFSTTLYIAVQQKQQQTILSKKNLCLDEFFCDIPCEFHFIWHHLFIE